MNTKKVDYKIKNLSFANLKNLVGLRKRLGGPSLPIKLTGIMKNGEFIVSKYEILNDNWVQPFIPNLPPPGIKPPVKTILPFIIPKPTGQQIIKPYTPYIQQKGSSPTIITGINKGIWG